MRMERAQDNCTHEGRQRQIKADKGRQRQTADRGRQKQTEADRGRQRQTEVGERVRQRQQAVPGMMEKIRRAVNCSFESPNAIPRPKHAIGKSANCRRIQRRECTVPQISIFGCPNDMCIWELCFKRESSTIFFVTLFNFDCFTKLLKCFEQRESRLNFSNFAILGSSIESRKREGQ
jgi:hypothetical protein